MEMSCTREALLVFIGTKCVGAAHNAAEIDKLCKEHDARYEDIYLVNCQEIPAIRHITIEGDWHVESDTNKPL